MDHQTAFSIGASLMIANGGVLGLVHREILPQLQPSAVTWRRGTLLNACACVIFAVAPWLTPASVILLTNPLLILGTMAYWQSLRQFHHRPDRPALFIPGILAMIGVVVFLSILPSFKLRLISIDLGLFANLVGCAHTLLTAQRRSRSLSRLVLAYLFAGSAAYILLRVALVAAIDVHLPADQIFPPPNPAHDLAPVLVSVLPVVGTTAFLLMCAERLKRRWKVAASTDYLTGLPNRRTLHHRGAVAFERASAGGAEFAVALVDIDHFKSINDRFGHDVGDQALRHIGHLLASACRDGEMAARQGGEEFVVLLDGADADHAQIAAERLRRMIEASPYDDDAGPLALTVSIGVAALTAADSGFDHLLSRADQALYRAKAEGRNRVVLAVAPPPSTQQG
jgi:diguanylate cyclase (GGDEF)-like protein